MRRSSTAPSSSVCTSSTVRRERSVAPNRACRVRRRVLAMTTEQSALMIKKFILTIIVSLSLIIIFFFFYLLLLRWGLGFG